MAVTRQNFSLGKRIRHYNIMYYRLHYRRSSSDIMHGTAPEFNYWFGWVRLTHFIAAFIFIINFLVRIYWFFAGNTFSRWPNYIPLTKKQWRGIFETTKVDVLLLSPKPVYDIGHNSLAAFTILHYFSHNYRTVCYRTGNVLCRLRQYFSSVFRQTVNHYGRILSGKGHTSYSHVGIYPIRHCSYLSGILPRLYRTERHCIIDHRRLEIYRRTSRERI